MFPSASLSASPAKLLCQILGRLIRMVNPEKNNKPRFLGDLGNPAHIPGFIITSGASLSARWLPAAFQMQGLRFHGADEYLLFIHSLIKTNSSSSQWALPASLLDLTHFEYWFLQ